MTSRRLGFHVARTVRILAVVIMVGWAVNGLSNVAQAASHASCANVRAAVAVAVEVPTPGKKWVQAALAVLPAGDRKVIATSRATFLATVAKDVHADWAAVDAAYERLVSKAKRGLASKPSPPPPASHYVADVMATLTPGWQSYGTHLSSAILGADHCKA